MGVRIDPPRVFCPILHSISPQPLRWLGSRAARKGGPCSFPALVMNLNVYVDAFNLYYGCLMDTPFKWLNLRALSEAAFPADQIKDIHYGTARIRPNPYDPDKPIRQVTYFRALRTLPGLHIHEGSYSRKVVKMPLHPIPAPPTPVILVKVVKIEEKGSAMKAGSPRGIAPKRLGPLILSLQSCLQAQPSRGTLRPRTSARWHADRSSWPPRDSEHSRSRPGPRGRRPPATLRCPDDRMTPGRAVEEWAG